MGSPSKTNAANPYIRDNPLLQRRSTRQKLFQGAVGSKLLAITALMGKTTANPKESPGKHEDLSKEARQRIQTSKFKGRWLERINKGGNQGLRRHDSSNNCTPIASSKHKNDIRESNGHIKQTTTADDVSVHKPIYNGKCNAGNMHDDVGGKATTTSEHIEHKQGGNSVRIPSHSHTNGITSCTGDQTDTGLPTVEQVNGVSLSCQEQKCGSDIRKNARFHKSQPNGQIKSHNHKAQNTRRDLTQTSQGPVMCHQKPKPAPCVFDKSLAEWIIENRSIAGCLLDFKTTTECTPSDNGCSKSIQKSGGGELGSFETDQSEQAKSESEQDAGTHALKKHQPDVTPVEGENSCSIVKRRQRKAVAVCQ